VEPIITLVPCVPNPADTVMVAASAEAASNTDAAIMFLIFILLFVIG
jgi:hypothetical protein